jgi:hypothetical protein
MKKLISMAGAVLAVLISTGTISNTAEAGETPYVVRGNQHILIGITLDEKAVRAALPKGLTPAKGMTGGINLYTSNGGEGVKAYGRSYVWVDLDGQDSVTGTKARYVLWAATSTGPGKLKKVGTPEVQGDTALGKSGRTVSGALMIKGNKIMTGAIELNEDGKCGPISGTMNYPSLPKAGGKIMMTQYAFSGTACGAKPKLADIAVGADHPLAKFKPTKLVWAAYVPDLSFSGSPLLTIKMAEK